MNSIIKKFVSVICLSLCLTIGIGVLSTHADAATWKKKTINSSSSFNNEWEKTVTYKLKSNNTKIGTMTYGYHKFLWVEKDYVWTKSGEGYTLAEIQRISVDADLQWGKKAGMDEYSKIEVSHENFNIMYQIKFFATYGETTESETNTSIR